MASFLMQTEYWVRRMVLGWTIGYLKTTKTPPLFALYGGPYWTNIFSCEQCAVYSVQWISPNKFVVYSVYSSVQYWISLNKFALYNVCCVQHWLSLNKSFMLLCQEARSEKRGARSEEHTAWLGHSQSALSAIHQSVQALSPFLKKGLISCRC